jgi:hypothetical protein
MKINHLAPLACQVESRPFFVKATFRDILFGRQPYPLTLRWLFHAISHFGKLRPDFFTPALNAQHNKQHWNCVKTTFWPKDPFYICQPKL